MPREETVEDLHRKYPNPKAGMVCSLMRTSKEKGRHIIGVVKDGEWYQVWAICHLGKSNTSADSIKRCPVCSETYPAGTEHKCLVKTTIFIAVVLDIFLLVQLFSIVI